MEELEYSPSNIHLIGHSLGAHVAGDAGRRHRGIRRITGLDPARLYFENTPDEVSLDASDAVFVDVIHTDTEPIVGVGIVKPVGHFDFYPNGGRHMTGCPSKFSFSGNMDMNTIIETMACNHLRAFQYYIESIRNPRGFLSYPCPRYDMFIAGICFPCPFGGCPSMGYYSELSYALTKAHETFYLNTGGTLHHFSSYRYKMYLSLTGKIIISGQISISLFVKGVFTPEYEVIQGTFLPGTTYFALIDLDITLDGVRSVTYRWTQTSLLLNYCDFHLVAERIDVQSGEDGTLSSFCTAGTVRDPAAQTLASCTPRPPAPPMPSATS